MGNPFKLANREEVVRYEYPGTDGQHWIEMRAELSKQEANKVLSSAPSGERDIEGGLNFLEKFFGIAVTAWTMTDEADNPVLPTVEVYRGLESNVGRWIDDRLGEHLQRTLGRQVEELEGESKS